jgi:hypothetical protein
MYSSSGDGVIVDPKLVLGSYVCPTVGLVSLLGTWGIRYHAQSGSPRACMHGARGRNDGPTQRPVGADLSQRKC